MKSHQFTKVLAILFTISLVAPSVFLIKPQPVYAMGPPGLEVPTGDWITRLKETLNLVSTYTNTAANVAEKINTYYLQPLAFVLSGNLMKLITAGVIQFVIGKANGTGIPQFVTDVQKSMQTVGDAKALAFFDQFGRNSNSPFAGSISSALRMDYLSKTSLAGFWAANMNTLAQSTPSYQPGFLTGNWSQGGIAAWFALTTQTQNNPYTFYPAAQAKLETLIGNGVGGATGARLAELNWGQGFLSWCGASDTTIGELTTTTTGSPSATSVNPGDPCTEGGKTGTIKTPGSVISATLNKVLGGQQDIITRMGNVGPEINGILKNISTVMQTVNFATQILGGSGSGGLFGVDQPSSSGSTSRLMQYQTSSGSLGVTNYDVNKGAATLSESGPDMLNQIAQYESAWNTIAASANTASTSVMDLANFCTAAADTAARTLANSSTDYVPWLPQPAQPDLSGIHSVFIDASRAQATAARGVLTTEITLVLNQAAATIPIATAARNMVNKVQKELNATSTDAATNNYIADIETLQTMHPTADDVANVQQEAQVFGMAAASPAGSLTVSGGSLVDQMNLIRTNAAKLKTTVCTESANVNSDSSSGV